MSKLSPTEPGLQVSYSFYRFSPLHFKCRGLNHFYQDFGKYVRLGFLSTNHQALT